MLKQAKKRKVNFECHTNKTLWIVDYFVIKLDDKALYLLCNETIVVLKEYNMC